MVSPDRVMQELDIGRSSLDELEDQGLLRRVPLGTLRVVRYRRDDLLALAGVDPLEPQDAAEAGTEAT